MIESFFNTLIVAFFGLLTAIAAIYIVAKIVTWGVLKTIEKYEKNHPKESSKFRRQAKEEVETWSRKKDDFGRSIDNIIKKQGGR